MTGLKQLWWFRYFVQFANIFLNVFLFYFRFCHICVAIKWTDYSDGRRQFLCIEVHRDCSSGQQCSTVWRHKAIWSEGLCHYQSYCVINKCEVEECRTHWICASAIQYRGCIVSVNPYNITVVNFLNYSSSLLLLQKTRIALQR